MSERGQAHTRAVRRGNTSGLIGLWNQVASSADAPRQVADHTSGVTAESLKLREAAHRRVSAREPPKFAGLAVPDSHPLRTSSLRVRKTSEIARPEFKIKEEEEGCGAFASAVAKEKKPSVGSRLVEEEANASNRGQPEKPVFSFMSAPPEPVVEEASDEDDDDESMFTNKMIMAVKGRERRRGSKTTDDIQESVSKFANSSNISGGPVSHLGRSKSVRQARVKFGLNPMEGRPE